LDFLSQQRENQKKTLIFDELLWKSQGLAPEAKGITTIQALRCFLPKYLSKKIEQGVPETERCKADVLILTVKKCELRTAKIAFNINLQEEPEDYIDGIRCWKTIIAGNQYMRDLNIILTMVAEKGNVPCAITCSKLLHKYDVELCVLVGIAAGKKGEVELGDVIAADTILDYEMAKLLPNKQEIRPRPFSLDIQIGRDLEYFDPRRSGWNDSLQKNLELIQADPHEELPNLKKWTPKFRSGVIISGEKIIADGKTIDKLREKLHSKILAAEMEGSGFARACKECGIPWLVFRGISDFGDPKTKNDLWQSVSALAASTATKVFLERGYRRL
jgi:nucleoside phosphorylase